MKEKKKTLIHEGGIDPRRETIRRGTVKAKDLDFHFSKAAFISSSSSPTRDIGASVPALLCSPAALSASSPGNVKYSKSRERPPAIERRKGGGGRRVPVGTRGGTAGGALVDARAVPTARKKTAAAAKLEREHAGGKAGCLGEKAEGAGQQARRPWRERCMNLEYNRREGAAWGRGGGVMGEGGGREERGSGSATHIFSGRPPRGGAVR